jgi:hypothetical protein
VPRDVVAVDLVVDVVETGVVAEERVVKEVKVVSAGAIAEVTDEVVVVIDVVDVVGTKDPGLLLPSLADSFSLVRSSTSRRSIFTRFLSRSTRLSITSSRISSRTRS